ncbi:MAG TPA: hypothetical protein VGS61_07070, partial [Acidimicrobiales bacterium]|nr:hypothetical protein [Acidimicrobiales bacterium]
MGVGLCEWSDVKTTPEKEGNVMSAWRRFTRVFTRTVTAGAAMVAIALPAAALTAGTASAAGAPTITSVTNEFSTFTGFNVIGSQAEVWQNGGDYWLEIRGTGFANDGGPFSVSTTAAGITVLDAYEQSSTLAWAELETSTSTLPGFFSLSITDDNGTATLANAVGVNAASTITGTSPTTVAANTNVNMTISGTLLEANGLDELAVYDSSGNFISYLSENGGPDNNSTESVLFDAQTLGLTAGTYFVAELGSVGSAGDGGLTSNWFPVSVTAPSITSVAPAAGLTVSTTQTLTETVIITGTGFLPGATVSLTGNTSNETVNIGTTTVTPTTITVVVTLPPNASLVPGQATVVVNDPGGYVLDSNPGALGISEPGASPTASPSLTCGGCELQFGVTGTIGAAANQFA